MFWTVSHLFRLGLLMSFRRHYPPWFTKTELIGSPLGLVENKGLICNLMYSVGFDFWTHSGWRISRIFAAKLLFVHFSLTHFLIFMCDAPTIKRVRLSKKFFRRFFLMYIVARFTLPIFVGRNMSLASVRYSVLLNTNSVLSFCGAVNRMRTLVKSELVNGIRPFWALCKFSAAEEISDVFQNFDIYSLACSVSLWHIDLIDA